MTIGGLTTLRLEGLCRSRMRRAVGARGGLALSDGGDGFRHGKPGLHHKRTNDGSCNNGYSASDCHLNLYSAPFHTMLVAQRRVPARLALKASCRSALTLRIGRAALRTGSGSGPRRPGRQARP